jgi:hypothetical protein
MTLIDLAEDLVLLADQAGTAADQSSSDAALATVFERLRNAREQVAPYGVGQPPWLDAVPAEARQNIAVAATRAAKAVRPLSAATDETLATYARSGDAAMRGALGAVRRDVAALADALREAQDDLVESWADSIWPDDGADELEILAFIPETASAGETVARAQRQLRAVPGEMRILSAAALADLQAQVAKAASVVGELERAEVPDDVLAFWRAISDGDEQPLTVLTADVHRWLVDRGASELFIVRRADAEL